MLLLGSVTILCLNKLMIALGANPVRAIDVANGLLFIVALSQFPAANLAMIVIPCPTLHFEVSRIVTLAGVAVGNAIARD